MKVLNLSTLFSLQGEFSLPKEAEILTISPLYDEALAAKFDKCKFVRCEAGTVAFVMALLCGEVLGGKFSEFDTGFLSAESNVGEEELPEILEFLAQTSKVVVSPEVGDECVLTLLRALQVKFGFDILNLAGECVYVESNEEFVPTLGEAENFDGAVIFTHAKPEFFRQNGECDLRGGRFFAAAAKLANGAKVRVKSAQGEFEASFVLDESLKGTIGFLGKKGLKFGFEKLRIVNEN